MVGDALTSNQPEYEAKGDGFSKSPTKVWNFNK